MTLYTALADRLETERGPLNIRLRRALSSSIDDSILGAGEVLPPERELAEKLQVSRSTVRQCLKSLVEAGVLRTIPGIGTMVIGTIPKALSRLSGFSEDMMLRGLVPTSKVLELNFGPVLPEIAFRTGMPLGTRVLTLARLRLAGGETLSYERAVVPVDSVGEDFDGAGSLYERMDARGYRPRRILQTLEAKEASTELSQLLGIDPGAAVLKIAQVGYGENATAVEDAITWYRGDRYKYVGEITA
jgi:GntR family transcriptional regulator